MEGNTKHQIKKKCGSHYKFQVRGERGSSPVGDKKRTIDFVFYNSDVIKPVAVLKVPDGVEIGEGRLPNMEFPSDHMLLAVKFDIRTGK